MEVKSAMQFRMAQSVLEIILIDWEANAKGKRESE